MTRTAIKTAKKLKIRRGDLVEVLTGKDVGRRGKVLEVIPTEGRLIVEKLNIVKRHTKPRPVKGSRGAQMTPGGVHRDGGPAAHRQRRARVPPLQRAHARRLPLRGQRRQDPPLPAPRLRRRHREVN